MSQMREHVKRILHRERCNRGVLLNLVEKMDERELRSFYNLIRNVRADAEIDAKRKTTKWGRIF